jgi:nicotinamidase-related amidase
LVASIEAAIIMTGPSSEADIMRLFSHISFILALLALSGSTVHASDKNVPQGRASVLIDPAFTVNRSRTAVLIMDYQTDIMGTVPEDARTILAERASTVLKEARAARLPIIYVVVRFREGYPEVNERNRLFRGLKESGRLLEGTPGAEIDAKVAPQPGDIVVIKRRVGAFSTTDLETVLRSRNISALALFGISTSGVVLSTVRWAADMDYSLVVISDLCRDGDPEVHRVLMDKVFPWQATVVTSREFLKALGAREAK